MVEFELLVDSIDTALDIIHNKADYDYKEICILYDLPNNRSCYLLVYDGELEIIVNKHYNHSIDEYDNQRVIKLELKGE